MLASRESSDGITTGARFAVLVAASLFVLLDGFRLLAGLLDSTSVFRSVALNDEGRQNNDELDLQLR
jgi:hypothetical protein